MGKTRLRLPGLLLLSCFLLAACGGPEAKKAKFLERGKEYSAKGDFVRAGLEFKNAIQIDPKFAEAYHQLGLSQLSRADVRGAYGSLSKATELDPKLLPAQNRFGRLLLMVGQPAKAMEKAELVLEERPGRRGRAAPERGGPGGREGDREGPRVPRGAPGEGDRPPRCLPPPREGVHAGEGFAERRKPSSCGGSRDTRRMCLYAGPWPTCTRRAAGTTRRRSR